MRILYTLLLLISTITIHAQQKFSAAEQQQISIETPGLFARSSKIQVDFRRTLPKEYCYPLPVGKQTKVANDIVEITTKKGDAVKSMFDGVVRLSKNMVKGGNTIVIRHSNGLETVYQQNAQNLVKVGDRVSAGQTIAIVGTGAKAVLSFFIMVDGNRVNPAIIYDQKSHALYKQLLTITKKNGQVTIKSSRKVTGEAETVAAAPAEKDKPAPQQPSVATAPRPGNAPQQDLTTGDPFRGNAFMRVNLDEIRPNEWHYPLDDSKVISGYGGARHHAGVDIKNGPGTNVYAAFDGIVTQSGNFSGYGKCITVRHYNGLETRYSHNLKNFVIVGDKVKAGQIIGIVGRTGRATTEHLHFETRIGGGAAFDPGYIFNHVTHTLQKGTLQFKRGGGVARLKDGAAAPDKEPKAAAPVAAKPAKGKAKPKAKAKAKPKKKARKRR